MNKFEELKKAVESVGGTDLDKFCNGNHTAGTRLRKLLQDVKRAAQGMRDEIQEIRQQRKTSKH